MTEPTTWFEFWDGNVPQDIIEAFLLPPIVLVDAGDIIYNSDTRCYDITILFRDGRREIFSVSDPYVFRKTVPLKDVDERIDIIDNVPKRPKIDIFQEYTRKLRFGG